MGTLVPLQERHNNLFVHDMEGPLMDQATKKPFFSSQKPIALINDIISLYSIKEDWIFSGPSEIG